jgi:hypothetical protein
VKKKTARKTARRTGRFSREEDGDSQQKRLKFTQQKQWFVNMVQYYREKPYVFGME